MWPLSDDRFRDLLDQVPAVFYADSHEPRPQTLYLSSNAEQILGAGGQEHMRDQDLWWRSIHPDDTDRLMRAWTAAYHALEPYRIDYRYLRPDGRTIWLREHAAPVRDEHGIVLHWQGILLDVTDELEATAELRHSEARLRQLMDGFPAFVYVISDEDDFVNLDASGGGAEIMGYDTDDPRWRTMTWVDIIHPEDRSRTIAAWHRARAEGGPFDEEFRQVTATGDVLWVHDHAELIRDPSGARLHWQGMVIDVTERVAAERAAAMAEHRFSTIESQLPVVVYAIDDALTANPLYVSPNAEEVLGVSAAQFVSRSVEFPAFVHPEDRDAAFAAWEIAFRDRASYRAEYRMTRPDGSVVWVRDSAEPSRAADGEVEFWQGVMLDVTEEHTARADLEASEARRRALIENLPAIVYEMAHDDDRRTLYISAGVEALLGYSHREWIEQPDIWAELLHPDDRETELAAHDDASTSGEPWSREYRLIAADGRTVWVRDVARLVEGPDGPTWQGVFIDITAQKLTEETLHLVRAELEDRVAARTAELEEANALLELEVGERRRAEHEARATEERFRRLVEDMPAVVYRWDSPDDVRTGNEYVSPGVGPMLGYAADEWRERYLWHERLHPHDRDRIVASVAVSEATGQTFDEEYRYLAKDGHVVWVHDRATLVARHPDGTPAQFQGVLLDITERKDAERSAAEAEARFREVIERGPVITYSYRLASFDPPVMRVEYVSPEMGAMLGYPTEELAGAPERWRDLIHPDDVDATMAELVGTWASGAPWDVRCRMLTADGRVVHIRSRGRCVERDEGGRPWRFVGALSDETTDMEARLVERDELHRRRDVTASAKVALWTETIDANGVGRYDYISPEVIDLLGYTPDDLLVEREHFPRLVHPDDLDVILAADAASDADPEGRWDAEYRIVRRDGEVRWVRSTGRRATPLGATPAVWHGITVDVTRLHADDVAGRDRGAR